MIVRPELLGGGPLIAPSTSSMPAGASTSAAIRETVMGETAFSSATSGVTPARRALAAMEPAISTARSGGPTLTTIWAAATTASRSGTSSSPAASARRTVRALRPATVATTRAPPRRHARPRPLPIAPGLTTPMQTLTSTVCKQRSRAAMSALPVPLARRTVPATARRLDDQHGAGSGFGERAAGQLVHGAVGPLDGVAAQCAGRPAGQPVRRPPPVPGQRAHRHRLAEPDAAHRAVAAAPAPRSAAPPADG